MYTIFVDNNRIFKMENASGKTWKLTDNSWTLIKG